VQRYRRLPPRSLRHGHVRRGDQLRDEEVITPSL